MLELFKYCRGCSRFSYFCRTAVVKDLCQAYRILLFIYIFQVGSYFVAMDDLEHTM